MDWPGIAKVPLTGLLLVAGAEMTVGSLNEATMRAKVALIEYALRLGIPIL